MIILNMIVKNEAHCIERCLRSVRDLVSYAVIVDTGSTDNTLEVIARTLPAATVVDKPWVNFGHNRSEAFQLAKEHASARDYIMLIDADEELFSRGWSDRHLAFGIYGAWHATPMRGLYVRPFLLQASYDWYWQGAVHEELQCRQDGAAGEVFERRQALIIDHFDSARNQQGPRKKYLADAELLRHQPYTPRNAFYLAQSYRDAGCLELAWQTYKDRSKMTGYDEETWYAIYQMAVIQERLGKPLALVRDAYMAAYNARPGRAEPLYRLKQYLKARGCHRDAAKVHDLLCHVPLTADTLFVEPEAYIR